jgi:5-methylcytosine-specific restriction endonuclease McrA
LQSEPGRRWPWLSFWSLGSIRIMAKKARTRLSKTLEKRVFQEASSKCAFCPEAEVVSLQIHHIDGAPSNNAFENLILVCASCHTKITSSIISEEAVRLKKRQLHEHKGKLNHDGDSQNLQIKAEMVAKNSDKKEILLIITVVNMGRRPTYVRSVTAMLEPREMSPPGNPSVKLTPTSSELIAYQKNPIVKIDSDGDMHVWQMPFKRKPDLKVFEKDGEPYGKGHVELTSGQRLDFEFLLLPESAWTFLSAPIAPVFDDKVGHKCSRCGFIFLILAPSHNSGSQLSATCPRCKHVDQLQRAK